MGEERFGDNFYNTLIMIKDDSFVFAESVTCLMILNDLGFIKEDTYTEIGLFLEKVNGTSLDENEESPDYNEVVAFIYDKLTNDELLSVKFSSELTNFDQLIQWLNDNVKLGWMYSLHMIQDCLRNYGKQAKMENPFTFTY